MIVNTWCPYCETKKDFDIDMDLFKHQYIGCGSCGQIIKFRPKKNGKLSAEWHIKFQKREVYIARAWDDASNRDASYEIVRIGLDGSTEEISSMRATEINVLAGVNRGHSFRKINAFLKTEEGMDYVDKYFSRPIKRD